MGDYPMSALIHFCIPLNYGAQGACCYPRCPFVKAASPLPLITQTGNDAWRPQLLPVSTKNTVMNVTIEKPRVLAKKTTEGQLSPAVRQTNSFLSGEGQLRE